MAVFRGRGRQRRDIDWPVHEGDIWRYATGTGSTYRLLVTECVPPDAVFDYPRVVGQFVTEDLRPAAVETTGGEGGYVPVGRRGSTTGPPGGLA